MNAPSLADARKDYVRSQLLEGDLPASPLSLFESWINAALQAGLEDATAMALATCVDNRPSCRIVLLKGIKDEKFTFYTSYASRKGHELSVNPYAAATFFWPGLERQVRLEGKVERVPRSKSEAYFNSRPLESRLSAAVSPQSQVVPDRAYLEKLKAHKIAALAGSPPTLPDDWGGYALVPDRIEFWQGGPGRLHDRILYTRVSESWVKSRLAP